jgi:hydroxymethylpyrimidine/phosphomethylpyrimidine kinase
MSISDPDITANATPIALTIAGLDPGCGAGITADLKTFAAHRLYGICCPTALTVQSTRGVEQVAPVDSALVAATLDCLAADLAIAGVKIGMLATAKVASAVADFLDTSPVPLTRLVLDPVLRSSSGFPLLDREGVTILRERLLPRIGWITPNLDELALLLDEQVADLSQVPAQAAQLQQMAAMAGNVGLSVIVTGGHLDPPNDYYLASDAKNGEWLAGKWVDTSSTHGTGCAFSSALLCQLIFQYVAGVEANGREAVVQAKAYVAGALQHAYPVGGGKGPIHHLFRF